MKPSQQKLRTVLAASIAITLLVVATSRAAKPVAAPKPQHKLFLWKVQSKTTTVYLLGSVHAAKKDLYPLPDAMYEAFEDSEKLVTEVPFDPKSQLAGGMKMVKAATLPKGDTLDKHLDKETKKLLAAWEKKSGFPAAGLKRFRPWLSAMMIMQLELPRHGYSLTAGIDQHFVAKARKAKKPMLGLETYDDQINIFAKLPEKKQLEFLKETLKDMPKIGETLDEMFRAWKRGDVQKLDELTLKDLRKDKDKSLYTALIVKRNNAWMKKIEKFLDGKTSYFIVVGAGHLLGQEGLVEQLRATGKYTISQY